MGCTSSAPELSSEQEDLNRANSKSATQSQEKQTSADVVKKESVSNYKAKKPDSKTTNDADDDLDEHEINKKFKKRQSRYDSIETLTDDIQNRWVLSPSKSMTRPKFLVLDDSDSPRKFMPRHARYYLAYGFFRLNGINPTTTPKFHNIAKIVAKYLHNDTHIIHSLSNHGIKSLLLDPFKTNYANNSNTRTISVTLQTNQCKDKTWKESGYRLELGLIGVSREFVSDARGVDAFMRFLIKSFHKSNSALETFLNEAKRSSTDGSGGAMVATQSTASALGVLTPVSSMHATTSLVPSKAPNNAIAGNTDNAGNSGNTPNTTQAVDALGAASLSSVSGASRAVSFSALNSRDVSHLFESEDNYCMYYLNMYHWNYLEKYFCYFGKNGDTNYYSLYKKPEFDANYCLKCGDSIAMRVEYESENETVAKRVSFWKDNNVLIGENSHENEFENGYVALNEDFRYFSVMSIVGCDCDDEGTGGFTFVIKSL